jgi:VCBS repeat-containing protein
VSVPAKNRAGRVLLARALEPRFLLDGAALAAAADAAPPPPDAPEPAADDTSPAQDLVDSLAPAAANADDAASPGKQIVFVDSAVAEYEALIAGMPDGVEVVTLDAATDGVQRISEILAGRSGIDAIHIVSHGDDGAAMLGGAELSAGTLDGYAELIAGWGAAMDADADILFYGCDIAAGADGEAFVSALAALTGADVAASTDATGAAALGGDWDLELASGAIEAALPFAADAVAAWNNLLAAPDPGGDVAALDASNDVIQIDEDSGATTVRLQAGTLSDPDGSTPTQIRIISVTGGTLTQANGDPISFGAAGDRFTLSDLGGGSANAVDFLFTPAADRDQDATVIYVVVDPDDSGVNSAQSTMTIDIVPVNDQVNPGGDLTATQTDGSALSVAEDASATDIQITVGALTDPDGSTPNQIRILTVTGGTLTQSNGAAIVLGASGTVLTLSDINSGSANQLNLKFTPAGDRDTNASFTYVVVDADDAAVNSTAGTVTVPVAPVNDAPVVSGTVNLGNIAEDATNPAGVAVTALIDGIAFTDADTTPAQSQGIAITGTGTANGQWQFSTDSGATWVNLGTRTDSNALLLTASAANLVRFVPAPDFNGAVAFTFRGWDQTSGGNAQTVDVSGANNGGTTAFSSGTATGSLTVDPANDAPSVDVNETVVVAEGGAAAIDADILSTSDIDGDTVTYVLGTNVARGELRLNGVALTVGQSFTQAQVDAGQVTYVHDGSENFTDSFVVDVQDGGGSNGNQTVDISISPVNDVPVVSGSNTATVAENATLTLTTAQLGLTDPDNTNEQLVFRVESIPGNAELLRNFGGTDVVLAANSTFSQADVAAGLIKIRYTGAELTADTTATFGFSARDGAGGVLSSAGGTQIDLVVTVQDVNAQIDIATSTITANEFVTAGDATTVTLGVSDADGDNSLITFTLTSLPTLGTLQYDRDGAGNFTDIAASEIVGGGGTLLEITRAEILAGRLRYVHTGAEPTGGDASTTFGVTVTDNHQTLAPTTDSQTVTIDIAPVNDSPTPQGDRFISVNEGSTGNAVVMADLDIADPDSARAQQTYEITADAALGALFLNGVRLGVGSTFQQLDIDNGNLTYDHFGAHPADNDTGTAEDSVTFTVRDGNGGVVTGVVLGIDVVPDDGDVEPTDPGQPVDNTPGGGNDDPVIQRDSDLVVVEGGSGGIGATLLLTQDAETADHAQIVYTLTGDVANGTLRLNGVALTVAGTNSFTQQDIDDGLLTYTHDGGETTADGFSFTVADADGGTATGSLDIVITPVNDDPALQSNAGIAVLEHNEGGGDAASFALTDVSNAAKLTQGAIGGAGANLNFADPDNADSNQLVYTLVTAPAGGTIRLWDGATWNTVAQGGFFTVADVAAGNVAYFHNPTVEPASAGSFQVSLSDGGAGSSGTVTVAVAVTNSNDAPTAGSRSVTVAEGATVDLDSVIDGAFDDSDAGDTPDNVTLVLTALPSAGSVQKNGVAMALNDTFTRAELSAGIVSYVHDGTETFSDSFQYAARDDEGLQGSSGTVSVTVRPLNDDPQIVAGTDLAVNEGETATITTGHFSTPAGDETGDPDNTATQIQFRVTDAPDHGQLLLDLGDGSFRALGVGSAFTQAQLAAGLIVYRHSGTETTSDSVTFRASDSGGGSEPTHTLAINIAPVNDSPVLTVPTVTQVVNEDTALTFSAANGNGISFTDVDVDPGDTVQATLTVANGTLTLGSTTGVAVTAGADGAATMTIQGTMAQINAALDGLVYQGAQDYTGADSLSVVINDLGANGIDPSTLTDPSTPDTGGVADQQASAAIAINVLPINDAPVFTSFPGAGQTVNEDTDLTFNAANGNLIQLDDVDYDETLGAKLRVTLSVAHGTLTLSGTTGLTFTTGDGSQDATMVFTGTADDINAALDGLVYRGESNFNNNLAGGQAETLTVTVEDQGNTGGGGPKTTTDTVGIAVDAVNDAPAIVVPSAQTSDEDTGTPLTFSAANGNAITVADADAATVQVTLTVTKTASSGPTDNVGTLTLSGTSGLTFAAGDGTADSTMTFTGTAAAVNAALNGMVFAVPDAHDYGLYDIQVDVSDLGTNQSAGGGALTDSDNIAVTVRSANDAPTIDPNGTYALNEDPGGFVDLPDLTVADLDLNETGANTVTVTLALLGGGNGDLRFSSTTAGVTVDSVTGAGETADFTAIMITGTLTDVNAALAKLQYRPDAHFNSDRATETLRVTVNDNGNSAPDVNGAASPDSGAKTATQDIVIAVNPVNDAPVVTAAGTTFDASGNTENDAITIAGVSVTDLDAAAGEGTGQVQVTIAVDSGRGTLTVTSSGTVTGNGTAAVTITGTLPQVNAAIDDFTYNPGDDPNTTETITLTLSDLGNNGTGGVLTDSVQFTVENIVPSNDAPVVTAPGTATTPEDTGLVFSAANGNAIVIADPDVRATDDITVTLTVPVGTLTLGSVPAGLSIDAGANGSAAMTVTGTLAELNAALNGLTYAPPADANNQNIGGAGTVTLTVAVDDLGFGEGGAQNGGSNLTDSEDIVITVTPVNDAPVLTVGTPTFTRAEGDAATVVAGLSVADPSDSGDANYGSTVTLTLAAQNGTLSFASTSGGGASVTSGDGTATVVLTGSLAGINALLGSGNLTYTESALFNGTDTVTVTLNDQGNAGSGGARTDVGSFAVTTTGDNDPPVLTVPAAQSTTEDVAKVISGFNVTDPDLSGNIQVSLAVDHGSISVTGGSGATVSNDGTATVTVTGTLAQVNAAIASLTYTPDAHFNGDDTLTVTADDQGNNPDDPTTLSDTETVAITVSAVNDAPVLAARTPTLSSINEGSTDPAGTTVSAVLAQGTDSYSDPDENDTSADGGPDYVAVEGIAVIGTGGIAGTWQFSVDGTDWTDFPAVSAGAALLLDGATQLRFVPAADANGTATLTYRAWDQTAGTASTSGSAQTADIATIGTGGATAFSTGSNVLSVDVNAVNDAPEVAVPAAQTVNEDTALNIAGIGVSDTDAGESSGTLQVTLTVTEGTISLITTGVTVTGGASGSATVTLQGTAANLNAALATLSYQGGAHFNGNDTLTVDVSDLGNTGTGGALTDSATVAITVNAVNDAPVLGAGTPTLTAIDEDTTDPANGATVTAILGATFSDPDSGDTSADGGPDYGDNGDATGIAVIGTGGIPGTWQYSSDGGTNWVDFPAVGATSALLLGASTQVRFIPDANENGQATLSFRAWDDTTGAASTNALAQTANVTVLGTGGATAFSTAGNTLTVTVNPVNDQIGVSRNATDFAGATVAVSVDEDTDLALGTFALADIDIQRNETDGTDDGLVQARIEVGGGTGNGTVRLGTTTGLTFTAGTGVAAKVLEFSGTLADVQAALSSLVYRGDADFNGSDTVTIAVDDLGNEGSGGVTSASGAFTVTVGAVNDAPVATVPAAQSVDEDGTLTLTGAAAISIADVDAGESAPGTVQVTLSVTQGTLTVGTLPAGVSFVGGTADGEATLVLQGTVADLNTLLASMDYNPAADYNGADTLTVTVDDLGRTGAAPLTDTETVAITVNPVNDAPVLVSPDTSVTPLSVDESANLAIPGISVSDVDAAEGTDTLRVTLVASSGTLTLGTVPVGLAFVSGSANGQQTLAIEGTAAELNAALASLVYNSGHFNGAATVTVTVSDLGNTGAGGTLTDGPDVIDIAVAPVNDPPELQNVPDTSVVPLAVDEEMPLAITGISIADPDVLDGDGRVQVTVTANNGTISLAQTTDLTFTVGDGTSDNVMTFTGNIAEVNAAIATLTYVGNDDFDGAEQIAISVNDLGNFGSGGILSDTATIAIDVGAVIDPPEPLPPGTAPIDAQPGQKYIGFLSSFLTRPPDGAVLYTITSEPLDSDGNDIGTLILLDATTGHFCFEPDPGFSGPVTFTFTVQNQAATVTVTARILVLNLNITQIQGQTPVLDSTPLSGGPGSGSGVELFGLGSNANRQISFDTAGNVNAALAGLYVGPAVNDQDSLIDAQYNTNTINGSGSGGGNQTFYAPSVQMGSTGNGNPLSQALAAALSSISPAAGEPVVPELEEQDGAEPGPDDGPAAPLPAADGAVPPTPVGDDAPPPAAGGSDQAPPDAAQEPAPAPPTPDGNAGVEPPPGDAAAIAPALETMPGLSAQIETAATGFDARRDALLGALAGLGGTPPGVHATI